MHGVRLRNGQRGFILTELITVIAVIAPLAAVLTARSNETCPQMINALTSPNLNAIVVTFDEPVISTRASFSLSGGITVESAEQVTDTTIVIHLATALVQRTSYILTVNGLTDLSGNAIVPPLNTIPFTSGTNSQFSASA